MFPIISEIKCAIDISSKLRQWWRSRTVKGLHEAAEESVATRFVKLFEEHGVHKNQIPRFFGHGLEVKDFKNHDCLLNVLTEEILEDACKFFAVNREWLDGEVEEIYPCYDFYKSPNDLEAFLAKPRTDELAGILLSPLSWDESKHEVPYAVFVLQEPIGQVGSKTIYRHYICNNWFFTYWKARGYLTACVALLWKHKCYIYGRKVGLEAINKYIEGKSFIGADGIYGLARGAEHWYPEYMALRPEEFIADMDKEENDFGIRSGLELWLDLDNKGLMDTGLGAIDVRPRFENLLLRYTGHILA